MRRLIVPIVIFCVAVLVSSCLGEPPAAYPQASPQEVGSARGPADVATIPWVAVPLLILGMMLVITEAMSSTRWGVAGVSGALCLGAVFAAHVVAGTASWVGVVLLMAGLGLFLVEAHLAPGYGISAAGGVACTFLGVYSTLGGGSAGLFYPLVVSALMTLLAVIAFLAYLPRNVVWRDLGSRLQITVGRPYDTVGDIGRVEIRSKAAQSQGDASDASVSRPGEQIRSGRDRSTDTHQSLEQKKRD